MFAITPRLLLRPGWQEDAPAVHKAIDDETIVRNLARAPWPYALSDAEEFMQMPIEYHSPRWLIFQRGVAGSPVIGCIGIDRMSNGNIELGYWIGRDHWGQGYATEAGHAVLANARSLGYDQIEACHFVDNPASGQVLKKLGFRPTGQIKKRFSVARGGDVDAVEFGISLSGASEPESELMRPLAA